MKKYQRLQDKDWHLVKNGRLYVLGEYNNKIYFGTITTICEDIFKDDGSAEIYDRH